MRGTGFFAATAKAKAGSRRDAYIVVEQDRLPVAYATAEGALGRQAVSLSPVVVLTGKGYVGIAPEQVLVMI